MQIVRALAILFAALSAMPLLATADSPSAGVSVVNFAFEDDETGTLVTLATAGEPVVWRDVSGIHTVTATDGSFHSGQLRPGETFTRTFEAGTYAYACQIHPTMRGVLVVS